MLTCGCGKELGFEFFLLHEHQEPTCHECMIDAIDCSEPTLVRKIDMFDYRKEQEGVA